MDEDATWYGSIDVREDHIVLDGFPVLPERGTAPPPPLGQCLLWPRSPISATAELLFSKWQLSAILYFNKLILNSRYGSEDQCVSSCKILWWSVKPLRRYGDYFLFVKMATVCRLGFSRCGSSNGLSVQEGQTASAGQIPWRSVKPLLRYGTQKRHITTICNVNVYFWHPKAKYSSTPQVMRLNQSQIISSEDSPAVNNACRIIGLREPTWCVETWVHSRRKM